MKKIACLILCACLGLSCSAATPSSAQHARAQGIVQQLGLDKSLESEVAQIVAEFYATLSDIHGARDAELIKARAADEPVQAEQIKLRAEAESATAQTRTHYEFVARLNARLSLAQVEQIKDGLTYGVAPNTMKVYEQMLPEMTAEQRTKIWEWLLEAREHAMDAGSSQEKHAWFGKYKGRINNYLSKAGIDMKAAEKNLKK